MEVGTVSGLVDGSLSVVLTIITVALDHHSQRLFSLPDEGSAVVVLKTVVFLSGFRVLDGDIADEPVVVLAEGVVVEDAQTGDLLAVGTDVVVAQQLVAPADCQHRLVIIDELVDAGLLVGKVAGDD